MGCFDSCVERYAALVVKRPCVVILMTIFVTLAFVAGAIIRGEMPDFENASKGFESRGTELDGRIFSVDRALEITQCAGKLSTLASEQTYNTFATFPDSNKPWPTCTAATPGDLCLGAFNSQCDAWVDVEADSRSWCAPGTDESDCNGVQSPFSSGRRLEQSRQERKRRMQGGSCVAGASQTCNACYSHTEQLLRPWGVQLVFEKASSSSDLLSAAALRGMCDLAEQVHATMGDVGCERGGDAGNCCAARSLGTYAALLTGKPSCGDLTDADAAAFRARLHLCREVPLSYVSINTGSTAPAPPPACEEFNAVFDSFNALIDSEAGTAFAAAPVASAADLDPRFVKLMLPFWDSEPMSALHLDILEGQMQRVFGGHAKLTAYDLNDGEVKFSIFSEVLFSTDMPQIGLGACVIVAVLWLYSGSLLFTLCAFMQINLAIAMAFGMYMIVLWIPFFPFINMTGTFLCIGIGADDIFVLLQSFDDCIRHRPPDKRGIDAALIKEVVLDAGSATFVTSLTTAGAFFASTTSTIASIKCFGAFCGLVVLCDWLVMLFLLPPLAVLYERHVKTLCCRLQSRYCLNTPLAADEAQLERRSIGDTFVKCLGPPLTHPVLKVVWVVGMLAMGIVIGLGFLQEGFRLPYPSTSELQMLRDDSPFERYCCVGPKAKTRFTLGAPGSENGVRYVLLMFGLDPVDNGNPWDPRSYPSAQLLSGTDLTSAASQQFLHDVSEHARASSWFAIPPEHMGFQPTDLATRPRFPYNSTFDNLFLLSEMPCASAARMSLALDASSTCCGLSRHGFPYAPSTFSDCLADLAAATASEERWNSATSSPAYMTAAAGLDYWRLTMSVGANVLFDGSTPKVLTLAFPTNTMYSEQYDITREWWDDMNDWAAAEFATVPAELDGAYISVPFEQLSYFALQTAMADSSAQSAWIALIIACVVLAIVTQNVLVALYTTLTVVLIILTVSGILLSQGWEQGIMESIIISCGIGMACDFAAHVGFAYRQANLRGEADTRALLARIAVRRMIPALTAAAFSTGVMALFMTQAGTLFTIRFGIFILLLMVFGWLYAIFFLLPLLATIGPLGGCCEPPALCAKWSKTPSPDTCAKGADGVTVAA